MKKIKERYGVRVEQYDFQDTVLSSSSTRAVI